MNEKVNQKTTDLSDIGVVVVTYNPEGDVGARLQKMAAQGAIMVVVDNASRIEERSELDALCHLHGWVLIANPSNVGVGAALNLGIRHLAERGLSWALLFDQDSEPLPDMSRQMLETLYRHPQETHVSIIGTSYHDPKAGVRHRILRPHPLCPLLFQKARVGERDLLSVSMTITSGSLLRLADFASLGPFDEGFFIDYIDTDFCLRCRRHDRLIAISAEAQMEHSLGSRRTIRWLGIKVWPTNHSPLRHYYISRNRIPVWKRHAFHAFHWWLFDLTTCGLWLFRVLSVESQKLAKLRAIFVGTWDGIRGKTGPCSPELAKSLEK